MRSTERGVVLLEVLAAIVILGVAGLALTELTADSARALHEAARREQELWDAERLLTAYTLLSRADLDRRIGAVHAGRYVVHIQRPERTLYRIAVSRADTPSVEDLVTVVYRPEPRDGP